MASFGKYWEKYSYTSLQDQFEASGIVGSILVSSSESLLLWESETVISFCRFSCGGIGDVESEW